MEFIKNDLIDSVLERYYETFSKTLDTENYVPDRYHNKILKFIFKNMKQKFKTVNKEYKKFLKESKNVPASLMENNKQKNDDKE